MTEINTDAPPMEKRAADAEKEIILSNNASARLQGSLIDPGETYRAHGECTPAIKITAIANMNASM